MTPEQAAAFVNAQAACALVERAAMTWTNNDDVANKRPLTYRHRDFMALQERYMIGNNAVRQIFHDASK